MVNSQTTLIRAEEVWKSYGSLVVLKGLSLEVFEGETLVILGRSGVGKSVLLKQIIGLELPDKGFVEVDGEKVTEHHYKNRKKIPKRMGMLFQGAALFDSMTIEENIGFYLEQHQKELSSTDIRNRTQEALFMVGLAGVEKKMPSDLSGGMRKRAALARLIVYKPQILLYDEPTTGLDPTTARQIDQLINQIKQGLSATSIVVTHDIRSALEVGDRLAFHEDGRIQKIASKSDFVKIEDSDIKKFFKNADIHF